MSELKVAVYCRVSTNHEEQESSLKAQISYYEKRDDGKALVWLEKSAAAGNKFAQYSLGSLYFMEMVLSRITQKHLSVTNNPPIRTTPTLATKPRKCFVTVSVLRKIRSKQKYIFKKHTTGFAKSLKKTPMIKLCIDSV